MTDQIKAKRKLTDFNFDHEGAAVALVGPSVGGAANGRTTLLTKSVEGVSKEDVEKATMVQVEMNIVDFLSKFFDLWYDDARVLAKIMGMDTEVEPQETTNWYEDYINDRVEAVTIMKSLVIDKSMDEIKKAVADLSSQEYLTVLKAQEQFEKNFDGVAKAVSVNKSSSVKAEGVTVSKDTISPSVDIKKEEEDTMSEFVSKSAMDVAIQEAVEKANQVNQAKLTEALDIIKQYEQEKVAVIAKARLASVSEVEKDEAVAQEIVKSLEGVSDEAFEVVIKALKKKESQLVESDLMKEVGTQGREAVAPEGQQENKTAELLKKQFEKGAK